MAEITTRRTGELLRKLFEILKKYPEGLRANIALETLASSVDLTAHEAGMYTNGDNSTRRFEKIVRFATVDCVKAGWLIKQKGTWTLTEDGLQAYERMKDPEEFHRAARRLYQQWKSQNRNDTPEKTLEIEDETVEQTSTISYDQAEEQAWNDIERFLKGMNPYEFQELVANLLEGMGYYVSWISPPGKDGGIDIIAHPDPLGTQSPRLKVQVKRHTETRVDQPTVQSFISTINENDAGVFVCTSGFTRDAENYARSQERRKIMLLDFESFTDLWIDFHDKLDDAARSKFPLTPIYFLTPKK